jgi:hypothetical protein
MQRLPPFRVFGFALLLLSFDVLPQVFEPVSPGQEFKGEYINIRAPNSAGWRLVTASRDGMEFGKPTQSRGENLSAHVLMFGLEPTQTPDQFVALIKSGITRDTDPSRFEVLRSTHEYSTERGYPCVRYSASVRDKEAQTSRNTREVLLLETEALYCRHPLRDTTGFAAIYAHRGRASYPSLREEAEDFIKGIQVPSTRR